MNCFLSSCFLRRAEGRRATASDTEKGVQSPGCNGVELMGTEQLQLLAKAQEVAAAVNGNISFIRDGGRLASADQGMCVQYVARLKPNGTVFDFHLFSQSI